MPGHSFNSRPVDKRRSLRVGALALAALMLLTACATGAPSGGGLTAYRYSLPTPEDAPSEGEAIFSNLPTDFHPVRVSDSEFAAALTAFGLQVVTAHAL